MVFDRKRISERVRQGVGAVRLGHCEPLRESAVERLLPKRLMVAEGLIQLDDDRTVSRRPAMNVYREVVEFRERRRIVGAMLRLPDFLLEDEIGARHIEKSAGSGGGAAGLDEWADAWKIASPIAIE